MKAHIPGRYLTAVDIGTTKICVLIGVVDTRGGVDIVGIGHHPSHGLKKGVVVNVGMTVDSIKAALRQAEEMAGITVEAVTVGISGGHIKSYNSTGVVAIKGKDVSQHDIDRVIEAAKAIPIPQDQEILHVIPQYFRVDGQEFVLDSLGMYGVRLEAQVHIITGAVASAQNIIKACELAGVKVQDIVLEQLASADAVLTESERELGAGIIDIGGGTSDFAVYKDGRIRHSKVLPIAGNHFTNDLSVGLGVSRQRSEEIKKMHGCVAKEYLRHLTDESIQIPLEYDHGVKEVSLALISDILHFRAAEIIDLFADEIMEFRLKSLMPAGLVLTGGGSLLMGMKQLAEEKLGLSVRVGLPMAGQGAGAMIPDLLKSPIYSTAYGLLLFALGDRHRPHASGQDQTMFVSVFRRMKSWIYDIF